MKSLLTYLWHSVRTPHRRDFVSMGLGIAARAKRCAAAWGPHLHLCKAFQDEAMRRFSHGGSIAVLGAGRLLDVDLQRLASHFQQIDLYDADPSVLSCWKRAAEQVPCEVNLHCRDLTATIDRWDEEIRHASVTGASLDALTEALTHCAAPTPELAQRYDAVLSLNLLSQIPLYWRDRVQRLAAPLLTRASGDRPQAFQQALAESMRQLQQVHLELMSHAARSLVMLLSDTDFLYYRRDQVRWQEEPALLLAEGWGVLGFREELRDGWLWHIAPHGLEYPDYGVIHAVTARAYTRQGVPPSA